MVEVVDRAVSLAKRAEQIAKQNLRNPSLAESPVYWVYRVETDFS